MSACVLLNSSAYPTIHVHQSVYPAINISVYPDSRLSQPSVNIIYPPVYSTIWLSLTHPSVHSPIRETANLSLQTHSIPPSAPQKLTSAMPSGRLRIKDSAAPRLASNLSTSSVLSKPRVREIINQHSSSKDKSQWPHKHLVAIKEKEKKRNLSKIIWVNGQNGKWTKW